MDYEIFMLAEKLGVVLKNKGMKISVAESCTGGGICQAITNVPGCSAWFDRGFITYSNQAKIDMLDVKYQILEKYGAVSMETAVAMAEGALRHSGASIAVAATGIAGPEGGTMDKPVGTVYIGWAGTKQISGSEGLLLTGDRMSVRRLTVRRVLELVLGL